MTDYSEQIHKMLGIGVNEIFNLEYCNQRLPMPVRLGSDLILYQQISSNYWENIKDISLLHILSGQYKIIKSPMTMLEKFKIQHPNAPLNSDKIPQLCPYKIGYTVDKYCDNGGCIECWNKPYKEDY